MSPLLALVTVIDILLCHVCRCFPFQQADSDLKDEPIFKQEKCTVSWHADSTLEHFSTIGVYHVTSSQDPCTPTPTPAPNKQRTVFTQDNSTTDKHGCAVEVEEDSSWRLALKVHYDAEGPNVGKAGSRAAEMKDLDPQQLAVPPVLFALPNKSAYFLLDDFNHHHQHSGDLSCPYQHHVDLSMCVYANLIFMKSLSLSCHIMSLLYIT
jgi:hypothetical protein